MNEIPNISDVLMQLLVGNDLDAVQVRAVMAGVLDGAATSAQIAAFAVLLRAKGETTNELATLARTMLEYADTLPLASDGSSDNLIDTCGTGGDRSHSFNISTVSAIVAAGAGAKVAKHGNRVASSACGSADVLEQLGIAIELGPEGVAQCIEEVGIGFCFAPRFHSAMRFAGPTRKELGIPTTFNFLGPLANPAHVKRQVIGVSDPSMADRIIGALAELGATRAMVVFGHDGLDELTTTDVSTIRELRDGKITRQVLEPLNLGLPRVAAQDLRGGTATDNAAIVQRVLAGESGPQRDIVLLNTAAALVVADIATDFADGVLRASEAIDSGSAASVLDRWITTSNVAAGS